MTYISGLEDLIERKKQHPEYEMILHSDQGSVYASKKFNELLPMYNITHSMSRAGTPTDNAAMEAINGWIKAGDIWSHAFPFWHERNIAV